MRRAAPESWAGATASGGRRRRPRNRPRRRTRPSSTSMDRSCSAKSGLPSAACTIRSRTSAVSDPTRLSTTRALSSSDSGSSWMRSPFASAPQDGRCASSSGRAAQTRRTGACRDSATRSTRSRKVASPQCTSSKTMTSGFSSARASKSLRVPQKTSSTGNCCSERPTAEATRSSASSAPGRQAASRERATSGGSSSLMPATWRTTSSSGQNVMPRPYGRQRPRAVRVLSPTTSVNSCVRRDLPSPAAARTVTRRHLLSEIACSSSPARLASSRSRPKRGRPSGRRSPSPSRMERTRYAGTGSGLPLSSSFPTGSTSTASRTSRYVDWPMRMPRGGAACSRRAATLTTSPVASRCPLVLSPATTSPVFTPVRWVRRTPQRRWSSSFSASRPVCISAAARTARSASSSWIAGRPKTAMIASPMYFSTVPPCASSTVRISSK